MNLHTIYTDGGMNRLTGDEAWGSVVDKEGDDLIVEYSHLLQDLKLKDVVLPVGPRRILISKFTDVAQQQNNGAELLAFLCALRITQREPSIKCIKCDSDLLVKYWSITGPNPKTKKTMDVRKLQHINECITLRKEFESSGGIIQKISGAFNKADLGFH